MKTLLATIMGLAIVVVANPASAYMVAITTSIPATSVADDTDLETALESAIDDVLRNAIDRRLRSEEHTSELQSRLHLVCRLLLEKKKKKHTTHTRSDHQQDQWFPTG